MIAQKREGAATISPIVLLFFLFAAMLAFIFAYRIKTTQIYDRLDDAVELSCQSVCIPDRYVPGTYHWNRADVVFTTKGREESEWYFTEPAKATAFAADLAYKRVDELLQFNFPPMVTDYKIEKFKLVNIISGTAYEHDCISGFSSAFSTAEEESYIEIKITVSLELPAFGVTSWEKEDTVRLKED